MIKCYKKYFLVAVLSVILPSKAGVLWNIQDGIKHYNYTNYKAAKEYFTDYLLNNPNDEEGFYELGRTCLKLKDKVLALSNFEKSYNLASKEKNLEKIKFKSDAQALNDYFDMAAMYFEDGNLQEADFYADLMLKMDNKNASAWFLKAKIANSKGLKEQAVEYMNNAILYNNKLLKTNLAKKLNIYSAPPVSKEKYYLFAFEDYYRGNVDSAIRNCKSYLESDSENVDINILLSKLYLLKNDLNSALETVENAKKTAENTELYLLEATIYNLLKDLTKEQAALEKAYKINPNNTKVLYSTGNYYLKNEDYKNAFKYFEALINTDDGFYEGYFGYILCLIEKGQFDNALSYIRKAVNLNPNQSEINYLLSLICFKQGQFDEAIDYIQEAIQKHKNSNYFLLKAKINYYQNNYKASLDALNETTKLSQTIYKPYEVDKYYIKINLKLKNFQNAQYYLNNVDSRLDKNSLLYKYNLYKFYKLEGNDKKADSTYNQIKSTRPNSINDYIDLSEIIYEEEGTNNSILLLDKAIKKNPDEPELYSQKIKIYSLSGLSESSKQTEKEMSEKFN